MNRCSKNQFLRTKTLLRPRCESSSSLLRYRCTRRPYTNLIELLHTIETLEIVFGSLPNQTRTIPILVHRLIHVIARGVGLVMLRRKRKGTVQIRIRERRVEATREKRATTFYRAKEKGKSD